MAENYGFFNGTKQTDGTYDRTYDASDFASFFAKFIGNGVYKGSGLNVVPKSGLTVTLKAGSAFVNGYWYELTEDMDFTLSVNSTSSTIYDLITITLDKTERKVYARKKENVYAGLPERSDTIYDLVVARISVGVGVSNITSSRIEDTRGNSSFCGYVTGLVDQLNVEEAFNQMRGQFDEWFTDIKDKLNSDVAGSLQSQINELEQKVGGQTAVVEKTTDENGGKYASTSMSFPSGFTKENSYVKSIGICKISGTGVGDSGVWYYGSKSGYDIDLSAKLNSSYIGITAYQEDGTISFVGRYKWRVVLEKL